MRLTRLVAGLLYLLLGIGGSVDASESKLPPQSTPARIWHFVLRGLAYDRAIWMVDRAKAAGFDAVQVTLTDGVRLDRAPWTPRKDAWSKAEFIDWVAYARERGMAVIPEVQLLTHQEKFFQQAHPDLMFNGVTYDPGRDRTYQIVFSMLEEIIDAVRPAAVHIGHDEVAGHDPASARKWLKPGEKALPADLFLADVLRVHGYLKERGIHTWMWGDMLLSPTEFPTMHSRDLNGSGAGYGKALRDKLPRDLVICDWHYFGGQLAFPSLATLVREGFRVVGVTWENEEAIRHFSRYAAAHGASGMMATTWFRVQRKHWDRVDWILRISGQAFGTAHLASP
jgi:hypothetical protein